MSETKLISCSEIEAQAISNILNENEITFLVKNQINSALLAGFGSLDLAVDIYIDKNDTLVANKLIEYLNISN